MRYSRLGTGYIKNKLFFSIGVGLAVVGLLLIGVVGGRQASAADCDSNAIIYCGTGSASQFISQVRANDSKNGHHDLQTVYGAYGLEPASYDKFVKYSRPGTAYKDGRIVVDGRVVATGGESIGRSPKSYSHNKVIGGTTYYESSSNDVFLSDSIPVMVMFNAQGVMQFAVLTVCGNPITGSPVTPTYSCSLLRHAPLAGQLNTYTFNTAAAASNGASIAKLVYSFGDGSTATTTDINTSVKHTYTRAGNFTAKVTVYVNLPGNQQVAVVSGGCSWVVTVQLPFYQCLQTAGALISQSDKYRYKFSTTTRSGNGASLAKLVYSFGDGSTATTTSPSGSLEHTYAKGDNYTTKVTAYFNQTDSVQKSATSTGCQTKIAVAQPYFSCTVLNEPAVDKINKYEYSFTAKADFGNGATLAKYVYNFGDGKTSTVTSTNGATSHTYTKGGNYTATVTVYANRHGESQASATSAACQKKFTVINPLFQCVQLGGSILDKDTFSYQFVATAKYGNGAQLVNGDFDFGDGKKVTGVKPSGTTITADHTYASAGRYDISATLHFAANGKTVTALTCKALVTPTTAPTPECKPGVPVGSAECTPCQYDNSLPSNAPQCTPPGVPPELPNTGAGDVIAVAGGVAVAAFLVYRQLLFRKHKAAFAAATMGTAPLPLGQPLDDSAPLTGTPLAPQRHSFRRNRPF